MQKSPAGGILSRTLSLGSTISIFSTSSARDSFNAATSPRSRPANPYPFISPIKKGSAPVQHLQSVLPSRPCGADLDRGRSSPGAAGADFLELS